MKKYLLSMFCLMLLAVLAPISIKAEAKNATTYTYTAPSELTAADMAAAQVIGMGTVQVDFTTEDYKLFKLDVSANQAYRYKEAKYSDRMGYLNVELFDAEGKAIPDFYDGNLISKDTNTSVYILVYSNHPTDSYFTISDGMFRDNVSQKSSDGTKFGFVPSVSGKYAFTLQSSYDKAPFLSVMSENEYERGDDKDYSSTVEMEMEAGKYYTIYANVYGPYTLSLTKSPAADAVIDQINKLGAIAVRI